MDAFTTVSEMMERRARDAARPSTTFADIARFIGGTLLFVGVIGLLIAYAWLLGA
jgi:hypothetical protein